MTDVMYNQIAEGAELPADVREDLERELDFALAADTLAEAKAQTFALAADTLAEAREAYEQAQAGAELGARAKVLADQAVARVLKGNGLTRTAAGIMPLVAAIEADLGGRNPWDVR